LLNQKPISKLCDELGLQPTVFYRWQKAFQNKARPNQQPQQQRIEARQQRQKRRQQAA
jgi:transposase-like protein